MVALLVQGPMFYKIAKSISILVILVSIYFAIAGGRFFPFSDYPMYRAARKTSALAAIVVHFEDGSKAFAKRPYLRPFNRLHLHQMIYTTSLLELPPEEKYRWLDFFIKERILKYEKNVQAVSLEKVEFPAHFSDDSEIDKSVLRTIYKRNVSDL